MNPVTTKIEMLERLLKELVDAAYLTLCESNGVSDNEWTIQGDKAVPEWPVPGFFAAIQKLNAAWENARSYFESREAEKHQKAADAFATAAYVVERFKETRAAGQDTTDRQLAILQRNIADAIYGAVCLTTEQHEAGARPQTMQDHLYQLLTEGKLVELKPDPKT